MKWARQSVSSRGRGASAVLRWHRRIGVSLAVVFLVVVVTGLFLNHAESLDLRNRRVTAGWLLDWYDMEPRNPPVAFAVGGDWIVSVDDTLFFNDAIVTDMGPVVGAASGDGWIVAAAAEEIALVTADGELVERMTRASLPAGSIQRVGELSADGSVAFEMSEGLFVPEAEFLGWRALTADTEPGVTWSQPAPLPGDLKERILAVYRGSGVSVHRVILDLHSGRLFGSLGVILVDVAGIGLLVLILTGLGYAMRVRPGSR